MAHANHFFEALASANRRRQEIRSNVFRCWPLPPTSMILV